MLLRPISFAAAVLCTPPTPAPPVRQVPDLTVHSPARTAAPSPGLRLRTHVRPSDRVWFGPEVPSFVPLRAGKGVLDLLDVVDGRYVALYRERFATCGIGVKGNTNCAAEVRIYDCNGKELAAVSLGSFMSRSDDLEVQDVRYDGTNLYFNEACQSYSSEAGGRCSSLVAIDPTARRLLWRTPSLVSNNWFAVTGDHLVTAYGFTGEPAFIRVVRKRDGAIMDRQRLAGTNFEMHVSGDLVGVDLWHDIGRVHYRMSGFDTDAPKLVPTARTTTR